MEDKKANNKSFLIWFRAVLVIAAATLLFGLGLHVKNTLLFGVVMIPIALAFVFSYTKFFTECKSRLIAFSLPFAFYTRKPTRHGWKTSIK